MQSTSCPTSGGTSGATDSSGGAGSLRCRDKSSIGIADSKGGPAGQDLVGHDAQRIHIRFASDIPSTGLLGGNVERGSHEHTGLGQCGGDGGRIALELGNTEVEHFDQRAVALFATGEKYVIGLQVTVDDTCLVRCGDRARAI